ncbi:MAG TPA: hypothetical protein PLB62_05585 [Candidatus Sumerlaeota bacterium]|nr:hypothetical protein [Candidatus Sumerlaeota bacterium]
MKKGALMEKQIPDSDMARLCTVSDLVDYNQITESLKKEGIPFTEICSVNGGPDGETPASDGFADIFVSRSDLGRACRIVAGLGNNRS